MIKNIIFDVGEVLLGYRWKEMLMDYGLKESEAIRVGNLIFNDNLWTQLDMQSEPTESIIKKYELKYPDEAVVIRWFIEHGELMQVKRYDVWDKVHTLKQAGYKIYLLSNYSKDLFEKHTKDAVFLNDIDGMVVSYQIHKIKPDPDIYRYLLQKYSLKAEECIFFDDRNDNTVAAQKLGIQAVTVESKDVLMKNIDMLLNQIGEKVKNNE